MAKDKRIPGNARGVRLGTHMKIIVRPKTRPAGQRRKKTTYGRRRR